MQKVNLLVKRVVVSKPIRLGDPRRVQQAVRAAHLYYMSDLDMAAIGTELGISRSSVSRLLRFARDSGLVDIRIHAPAARTGEIADEFAQRFGVRAHIVPTTAQSSDAQRLERVGTLAARVVGRALESEMTLGVAWGATISAVSRRLIPKELWNVRIVQLNGAGNPSTSGIDYASEILARFAEAYSARVEQFPVPAFFDDPATKVALWRERSTRRVLDAQQQMDIALFGLGAHDAAVPSHVYSGGYLEPADFDTLRTEAVVGDVATVFYRGDGSDADIDLNKRSSGPDLATIRAVPRRICVVSGDSKAAATEGAFAAGLLTDIVADENLARLLLHRHRPAASRAQLSRRRPS